MVSILCIDDVSVTRVIGTPVSAKIPFEDFRSHLVQIGQVCIVFSCGLAIRVHYVDVCGIATCACSCVSGYS